MFCYIYSEYWDFGNPDYICQHCSATFWYEERLESRYRSKEPKYSLCCCQGKIQLPPLQGPPDILHKLFFESSNKSKHFLDNIRSYNSMFSFTSMGGKIVSTQNQGNSPPIFKLNGQNFHLIGSLLPVQGETPKFAQLYIYDTQNEVRNRIHSVRLDLYLPTQIMGYIIFFHSIV